METKLGKISSIKFGLGGYQDAMIGLHICFSFDGSGICTTESAWDYTMIEHSSHCKWTEEERKEQYYDIMCNISKYLSQAKVQSISDLNGIPVEIVLNGNTFHSWRILEEVL